MHALGVKTNIPYLLAIVRHPAFVDGDLSTSFLAEHFANWKPRPDIPIDDLLALAAEAVTRPAATKQTGADDGDRFTAWGNREGWRNVK